MTNQNRTIILSNTRNIVPSTTKQHYDVIIVGAGMVGATLGLALGRCDMRVLLLDNQKSPIPYNKEQQPDLRVSALNLASVNILKNLHLWDTINTMRCCPFKKMAVWEDLRHDTSIISKLPFIKQSPQQLNKVTFDCTHIRQPALGYIVENRILQYCLHQAIDTEKSIDLYTETQITSFLSSPDDAIKGLQLSDGSKCFSKLIIGAEGANSQIRSWAGLGLDKRDYGQHALTMIVETDTGPLDITWQAFTKNGPVSLLPLPDCNHKHYASLVWYDRPEKIKMLLRLSDNDFVNELTDYFPKELPRIIKLHQRGSFPLAARHVQQYGGNGIALAGDAAHTINPLAGQGVNLGLMDVAVLVDVIKQSRHENRDYASSETLQLYQKLRKADNRNMLLLMDMFYYGFSNDITLLKIVRNTALALTNKTRFIAKLTEYYGAGFRKNLPTLAQTPN